MHRHHQGVSLLGTIEHPEPPLELVGVQASVERVGNLQRFTHFSQIGRGRVFPSAERRVWLIVSTFDWANREQHIIHLFETYACPTLLWKY